MAPNIREQSIDRASPIPAYQQIATDISKRIAQHEWRVNDKLPSEMELSKNYGVSRVTLRQAMSQLEQDDIIERFQGKGAYVKNNPRRLVQDLAFPSLDLDPPKPNPIRSRIIREERICSEDPVLHDKLHVGADTPLIHFTRLHYFEEKPVGLGSIWFPEEKVPGLSAASLIKQSISKTLYYTYHYNIASIDNSIESMKLDAVEASLLSSVYDAPGLMINSQYLLEDETPVEYSSTIWLSDCTKLHYKVCR